MEVKGDGEEVSEPESPNVPNTPPGMVLATRSKLNMPNFNQLTVIPENYNSASKSSQ